MARAHARLRLDPPQRRLELAHAAQALERAHHAALHGDRPARQPRAAAAGHDRHVVRVAPAAPPRRPPRRCPAARPPRRGPPRRGAATRRGCRASPAGASSTCSAPTSRRSSPCIATCPAPVVGQARWRCMQSGHGINPRVGHAPDRRRDVRLLRLPIGRGVGWESAMAVSAKPPAGAKPDFRTLSGEPVRELYTPEDLPAGIGGPEDPIGRPGDYPVHARHPRVDVPRAAVDDAPVRRLRHERGDQRALPLPARPRPDRALDGVRHAVADGPRLRPPARARRGRPRGRRRRHARRHADAVRAASTSARSRCR